MAGVPEDAASASHRWPRTSGELIDAQVELAARESPAWLPPPPPYPVGGCFVCSARGVPGPGAAGDPEWAAAVVVEGGQLLDGVVVTGGAGAPYEQGLLALREGPLLEAAVGRLGRAPQVLMVDATGRDHPRGAGLALHLGAMLDRPTVGVTHRPLVASGDWPDDRRGARSPLLLDGVVVGYWVRTAAGTRPLAAHAAWRTTPEAAAELVVATARWRTPEPIRQARQLARRARAGTTGGMTGR